MIVCSLRHRKIVPMICDATSYQVNDSGVYTQILCMIIIRLMHGQKALTVMALVNSYEQLENYKDIIIS